MFGDKICPRDNPRISGMILLQEKGKIHSLEDNSLMAVDPVILAFLYSLLWMDNHNAEH
jgi:hypothetical protein